MMAERQAEALAAMLAHHRTLEDEVAQRVLVLRQAVAAHLPYGPALGELVAFLADEVLPHADAEERTIYRAAAARTEHAAMVREMVREHRRLAHGIDELARASSGETAAEEALAVALVFAAHVAKENEQLLPQLVDDPTADLAALLAEMQEVLASRASSTPREGGEALPGVLTALLLDSADALARAGEGDQACRIAARAWAALRPTHDELAEQVTSALHRLARRAIEEPVALRSWGDASAGREVGRAETSAGAAGSGDAELDVRPLAPAKRHASIFAAFSALAPGKGFVLVNDHDPKPLRFQFEAEHAGQFTWDYLAAGPKVWRVRISKAA